MDNQFDYYGNRPQRPFTEKPGEQPPQENVTPNPAEDFQPQLPLMQQQTPPGQPQPAAPLYPQTQYPPQSAEQEFNPVKHQAVYQDGAFRPQQYQQPDYSAPKPDYPADQSDYSAPQYFNPNTAQGYRPQGYSQSQPQPPVQQTAPQHPPVQYPPVNRPVPPQNPYEQTAQTPKADKPKSNKGLIAVIIVLAVLLAGSLAGLFVYILSTGNEAKPNQQSSGIEVPEFTIPGFNTPSQDATKAPTHNESDYGKETDKNFSLKLNKKPDDANTNSGYNAEYAFERVSDSVVGILCYLDNDEKTTASMGSGIVITEDGYVVTNSHVIGNSRTAYAIKAITSDGKEYTAGVVGFDSRTDIAVLKLDKAKGLTAAQFGTSEEVKVGEDIIIVGNPGGLNFQNTMTKGIVSALDRDASKKNIVKYIQTDAAINPGNSGGPAVNIYGQVIGIASAKIAKDNYEGMGFCIPGDTAKTIVDDLIQNGYVQGRVKIGIVGIAVADMNTMTNLPDGICIETVDEKGPCGGSGLKQNDIITELDGEKIASFSDIFALLENHKPGDKVKLKYYRYTEDKDYEVEITLQADEG